MPAAPRRFARSITRHRNSRVTVLRQGNDIPQPASGDNAQGADLMDLDRKMRYLHGNAQGPVRRITP
jgi:hypothetical protein